MLPYYPSTMQLLGGGPKSEPPGATGRVFGLWIRTVVLKRGSLIIPPIKGMHGASPITRK